MLPKRRNAAASIALILVPGFLLAQQASAFRGSPAEGIVNAFAAAWAKADARAMSEMFTADADAVFPTGLVATGPESIRLFYAGAFASGYAGSKAEATIVRVRALSASLSIIDARWSIGGAHMTDGSARAPERGVLTALIVRDGSRWKIAALREQTSATEFSPLSSSRGDLTH